MTAHDHQLEDQLKRQLSQALDLADRISPIIALHIATALDLLDQHQSLGGSSLR